MAKGRGEWRKEVCVEDRGERGKERRKKEKTHGMRKEVEKEEGGSEIKWKQTKEEYENKGEKKRREG